MFSIFDRYLIREMLLPLALGLLVLTFVVEIPTILNQGAALLARGVEAATVVRVLVLLLPSSLSITIPMSVLLGILVAFGRLSADREFVAMQACGVSIFRVLGPVALVAVLGLGATAYEIIIALPDSNQTFREITFGLVASQVESDVKPRVFFQTFPDHLVYVRDVPPGGGWRDVFLADLSQPGRTTVYVARQGRIIVDRAAKAVQLQLTNGTRHTTVADKPDEYEGGEFDSIVLTLDPLTVFPPPPSKGAPEMTIAELRKTIAAARKAGAPTYSERFMIQYKFSFPVSCLVLALIGIGLGVSNRKDGKLASFALGFVVIFAYYVLLYFARAAALGGKLNPDWAPWIPHLLLGAGGLALLIWRARSADRPIRIGLPAFWRPAAASSEPQTGRRALAPQAGRTMLVVRIPHFRVPRPSLLDLYIARQYGQVFSIALFSLLGVFYISTFIDLADKLFRGQATTSLLLRYFFYQTPQFVYYVIPMAGLVATLVTIGVMTKRSELVVMRACGISLYRTSVPLILLGLLGSLALFGLEEQVLASANREADRLNSIIRGYPVQTFDALNRRWVAGTAGDIYYYESFTPAADRFSHFTLYDFDEHEWRLAAVTYANAVALDRRRPAKGDAGFAWTALNGWERTFATTRANNRTKPKVTYTPFPVRDLPLEQPSYFKTEVPDALTMTYGQLAAHVTQLRASGFNAVPQMVQLQKKVAFPFVTLVMTLLAVPFAVTTGRRGTLYGVGVGIVLAIGYWITMSVLGALGEGGVITPVLAAWAPNILFGAAALYMMLTVRT